MKLMGISTFPGDTFSSLQLKLFSVNQMSFKETEFLKPFLIVDYFVTCP